MGNTDGQDYQWSVGKSVISLLSTQKCSFWEEDSLTKYLNINKVPDTVLRTGNTSVNQTTQIHYLPGVYTVQEDVDIDSYPKSVCELRNQDDRLVVLSGVC